MSASITETGAGARRSSGNQSAGPVSTRTFMVGSYSFFIRQLRTLEVGTKQTNCASTARRGRRTVRPTRPAGPTLPLAGPPAGGPTRDPDLDLHFGTLRRGKFASELRPGRPAGLPRSTRHAQTGPIVLVGRPIRVPLGRAHIRRMIVEGATTQQAAG